jgi:ribosomal protein L37AE/L43A
MTQKEKRCLVCGKPNLGENSICPACKASIRGEALKKQKEIKKDADRALHKEGTQIEKK